MQTEALFENIADRIQEEISNAKRSIFIAVAWFTNKNLFNVVLKKAKEGCDVSIIISNDSINLNSSNDFELLLTVKAKVYKIGNGDTELMHNKFCVIDYSTVITGSYNWSYKAESNFENVIITNNDTTLAEQFITEFNNIRKKYYPNELYEEMVFPLSKIIKRLEILKNYILLEDIEELSKGAIRLRDYDFNSDLFEIIEDIMNKEFSSAINKIQNFISKNQQLLIWTDPVIAGLKLEVKNLENQINAFNNEKIELEKILSEFHHRHSIELGDVILEILKLRKLKYKFNETKYREAENDEKQYREQVESEKVKEMFKLSEDEKSDLKKKFRRATVLCHPDKFSNESIEIQKKAEEIFKELNDANSKNDITKVSEILANLEKGILTTNKGDSLSNKDLLIKTINKLKNKIKVLESEIFNIKQDSTYLFIISIINIDKYFTETKEQLMKELLELKSEINS